MTETITINLQEIELLTAFDPSIKFEVEVILDEGFEPTWNYSEGCVGDDRSLGVFIAGIESINGEKPSKYPRIFEALEKMDLQEYLPSDPY